MGAAAAELINDRISFVADDTTFRTTTNTDGCPTGYAGRFSFTARMVNQSGDDVAPDGAGPRIERRQRASQPTIVQAVLEPR